MRGPRENFSLSVDPQTESLGSRNLCKSSFGNAVLPKCSRRDVLMFDFIFETCINVFSHIFLALVREDILYHTIILNMSKERFECNVGFSRPVDENWSTLISVLLIKTNSTWKRSHRRATDATLSRQTVERTELLSTGPSEDNFAA